MKVEQAENEIWDLENAIKILTQIYEDPTSKLFNDDSIKKAINEYKKRKDVIYDCYINMELEDSIDQNTGLVHSSYKDTGIADDYLEQDTKETKEELEARIKKYYNGGSI